MWKYWKKGLRIKRHAVVFVSDNGKIWYVGKADNDGICGKSLFVRLSSDGGVSSTKML